MTIKIVLPEGNQGRLATGIKVFTEDGHEITGISGITITLMPDQLIQASLVVDVRSIENLEGVEAFASVNIIKPEAIDE